MNSTLTRLPILVLNVHPRCNCRCGMCDIWKVTESREMPVSFVEERLDEFVQFGVKWVVLTGGEPLMHSGLFAMCSALHSRGIRVTVLTSGLLIARHADEIAQSVDDLIASLDGPPDLHDRIRGVPGAFAALRNGVAAVRSIRADYPVSARCTVQKLNHDRLVETVQSAAEAGLRSVSFMAADLTSAAFNRVLQWPEARQNSLSLSPTEIAVLDQQLQELAGHSMVVDSPDHLRRIASRFRAYAGLAPHEAPRCNAPFVSAVIEVDGAVRPCFFHAPVAVVSGSFAAAINSAAARDFRESFDGMHEICHRCVCSLYY